eukprot:GFYU01024028.1.p1 GENE.GFYU01024028.1~~GFYU01024028.1.p1  ORF type:complete len:167 (+),score=14.97 GFYU01024028.1:126-626(+)
MSSLNVNRKGWYTPSSTAPKGIKEKDFYRDGVVAGEYCLMPDTGHVVHVREMNVRRCCLKCDEMSVSYAVLDLYSGVLEQRDDVAYDGPKVHVLDAVKFVGDIAEVDESEGTAVVMKENGDLVQCLLPRGSEAAADAQSIIESGGGDTVEVLEFGESVYSVIVSLL